MNKQNSTLRPRWALLTLALLVVLALGGCGVGENTSSTSPETDDSKDISHVPETSIPDAAVPTSPVPTAPPTVPALSVNANTALNSGNPSGLTREDAETLLGNARTIAWNMRSRQTQAVASIYGNEPVALQLNHTTNSSPIAVNKPTVAAPLLLSDGGAGMAAIAQIGTGRGLAYGADVLAWMAGTTREQQHAPFFQRAFRWVVTGSGDTALPSTLKFATAGYNANTVNTFLMRAGSTATAVNCAVADPANTCWNDLDLIVFGSGTPNSSGLATLVRTYLEAGKSVIYLHPSWIDSGGGRTVLGAMGMSLGGYPGNYFASASNVSVGAGRVTSVALVSADQFAPLLDVLQNLGRNDLVLDFSTSALPASVDAMHNTLAKLQGAGVKLFAEPDNDLYRALVLWADWHRTYITYGGKLSAKGDSDDFLRTYASDSWLWFNRTATNTPPNGSGDYMPASAANLAVSSNYEDIEVTIPQSGGITLVGRAAIPGKPVTIQIVDAAGATSFGVQTNYLRVWGKPLTDATYARPRRPNSFRVPLALSEATDFVTPFGGPLMLAYEGATPGTVVKLRIQGSAKYGHFDFTRSQSQADIDEASAAVVKGDFGWQTAKFVGGEVQQLNKFAKSVLSQMTAHDYVVGRLKGQLFDSNHFANGYDNMPVSTAALNLCTQLGWTCTGTLHKAPNVQHFIGWLATCGFLCSGNPSDGSAGIGSGWGHAHELGHNTVQRVMHIAPNGKGCGVECDNNILASATMLRQAVMLGVDTGHSLDHTGLYGSIMASRATNLSDESLRADMEKRLWQGPSQNPMRAVHFQMAFQYAKLRRGQPQPTMYSTLEFFQLLTKADRLVSRAWDASNKNMYGMGRFADNKISNEDLFYVLSSKIIGQDMRKHFAMYGIPLSQTALDSIADLNLPRADRSFYALQSGRHNQLDTGQWIDIETSTPAYPW